MSTSALTDAVAARPELELFHPRRKTALIIGSGIGGLSLGIRLQSLGFDTTILERLDAPGGRAYQRRVNGYTFDMGPTVITAPQLIEELFALERDRAQLSGPDFAVPGSSGPTLPGRRRCRIPGATFSSCRFCRFTGFTLTTAPFLIMTAIPNTPVPRSN